MKKLLLVVVVVVFIGFLQNLQAQTKTLDINQIYKDYSISLIEDTILKFDSISKKDIIERFENWGGQNFRSYESVKTSKTESQITLRYISKKFSSNGEYLIMNIEFKDNKIKISVYDDGNVYIPGYFAGKTYISPVAEGLYKMKNIFKGKTILEYRATPGLFNIKERNATASLALKKEVKNTFLEIQLFIITNNSNLINKSDW